MVYILKSTYLYRSQGYLFFLYNYFFKYLEFFTSIFQHKIFL